MKNSPDQRRYEGPARLLREHIDERTLREQGRGIPKSQATYLTEQYGEEGIGWDFDMGVHAQENELKRVLHEPEFRLANEAFRNAMAGRGYKLDDGTDVSGKVRRYVMDPDVGNVIVYPDGDIHASGE